MTIVEIIEKKSYNPPEAPLNYNSDEDWAWKAGWTQGFQDCASFATTNPSVLKELLQPFAEWIGEKYTIVVLEESNLWRQYNTTDYYTTEELISKYIQETNKPKEDAGR